MLVKKLHSALRDRDAYTFVVLQFLASKKLNAIMNVLGAVHKRRPQSWGERGSSSADIFRTMGVLQMRTSALFSAKYFGFLKIYDMSTRTGGRAIADKEGVNFSRFCADVFYGRPLMVNFINKRKHNLIS